MPANATISGIPIPSEALDEANRGSVNATPSAQERKTEGAPLAAGPIRGELDSYKPASYQTARGFVRSDR